MTPMRLSINIDHVATLRNARGGTHPDPLAAALAVLEAGADGITLHLREDRRHIRDHDVTRIHPAIAPAPLNFEMAATEEMVAFAEHLRPSDCCIVPEKREELTTEGGLDVLRAGPFLAEAANAARAQTISRAGRKRGRREAKRAERAHHAGGVPSARRA